MATLKLTIRIVHAEGPTNSKEAFWLEYRRIALQKFGHGTHYIEEYGPDDFEYKIAARFLPELAERASSVLTGRPRSGRSDSKSSSYSEMPVAATAPETLAPDKTGIALVLQKVEYNSLDMFLKLVGVDNATMLDITTNALQMYAITTFNESMSQENVNLSADIKVLDSELTHYPPSHETPPKEGKDSTLNYKLWGILNGSLIVPVIICLAIFYFLLSSLLEERRLIAAERATVAAQTERIHKTLLDENLLMFRLLAGDRPLVEQPTRSPSAPSRP